MLHSVTDSCVSVSFFFFFKQKTAYEMRISDGSSDVCSSDLRDDRRAFRRTEGSAEPAHPGGPDGRGQRYRRGCRLSGVEGSRLCHRPDHPCERRDGDARSEEHTSELQSLMRISYAVFCLKKKKKYTKQANRHAHRTS